MTRNRTRLTFAPGLQTDVAWSPDGRQFVYASDQSGNFDIWVQSLTGGNAIQLTWSPAHDRQPSWSPDGANIVFRSERDGGGLYVVPATGGPERRLANFGVLPRWAPDGSQVLFGATDLWGNGTFPKLYVVGLDGGPPRQILRQFTDDVFGMDEWAWHPDSKRVSVTAMTRTHGAVFSRFQLRAGLQSCPGRLKRLA